MEDPMNVKTLVLSGLALLALPGSAMAQNYWSAPAAACVPSDGSIQGNRYTIQAGKINHAGSNVDAITLYCAVPIEEDATDPDQIHMLFFDESTTANNYVTASLISMDRDTGSTTTIATISSESWDGASTGWQQQSVGFSHTFDFGSNVYYIRADILRTSTATQTKLGMVALEHQIAFGSNETARKCGSTSKRGRPGRRGACRT
jgi:hypothetical protein